MFNTDTTPGEAFDGIFYFTGRGLNWDRVRPPSRRYDRPDWPRCPALRMPTATTPAAPTAVNYFEWCQDHNKPLEVAPIGDVAAGGPATLPNPNIFTNGAWYGGTPYLGPDATLRGGGTQACASTDGQHRGQCSLPLQHLAALQYPGQPGKRTRLGLHVALAQRARDHHQQRIPRRNADDDAGRFPRIRDRRIQLGKENRQCESTLSKRL